MVSAATAVPLQGQQSINQEGWTRTRMICTHGASAAAKSASTTTAKERIV